MLLFVDYCWSLRLNELREVCPSLCEMRNFSPGQKHILGWGFCLAAHDEVSRAPFTAGSSKPEYRLTVVGSRGMP